MRRLSYLVGILFGLCLMVVSGFSYVQHRQSPPTYWVLYEKGDQENQTVYLSSLDGAIHKPIIRIQSPVNLQLLDWLGDGEHFLYQTYSRESGYELWLYGVQSLKSTIIAKSVVRSKNWTV